MLDLNLLTEANRLSVFWPDVRQNTPHQVVQAVGSHRLLFYKAAVKKHSEPVFIIPSLISLYYVLDLLPGKSFVQFLNQRGFDVFLLDWGYPEKQDQYVRFADLVKNRIPSFIATAGKLSKSPKVHLIGHCLGGTVTTLYTCLEQRYVQSLTLLTAPIDFAPEGKFKFWIQSSTLNFKNLQEAHGNIPWPLLHSTFLSMKPMATYHRIKRLLTTKMNAEQKKSYWATELWSQDSVALRGQFYLTLIHELYGKNGIQNGCFELEDGTAVRLDSLGVPILNLSSKEDHIVPHRSPLTSAAQVPSCPDFRNLEFTGGHVGCLINKKAYQVVWPQIADWLEGYSYEA